MAEQGNTSKAILCILDGFGWREETADNAVAQAEKPNFDRYFSQSPASFLRTDARFVGLPDGQFGNSEVGHLNLGAGRVVMQDLPRIDQAIADGLAQRDAVTSFIQAAQHGSGRVHLIGLLSPGGVHAHQRHMAAIVRLLAEAGLEIAIHAILDGRDTPPMASLNYWQEFNAEIGDLTHASVATVSGRYYTMDRDQRWERTQLAYDTLVKAKGPSAQSVETVIKASHKGEIGDEFIKPHVIDGYTGARDGDAVLCVNFRADRVRQILSSMALADFDGFDRGSIIVWSACAGLTHYSAKLDQRFDAWVPTPPLKDLLGDVLARAGLRQLRMAETEKYPHVTFFFNGGREEPAIGEDRIMVQSPKVATYDLQPEMSAVELTDRCIERLESNPPDFLLINFANPDMVGHTGDLQAAVKAVETVDVCLGRLIDAALRINATMLVTADHGNCELMSDPTTGGPHTSHTTNPVPVMLIGGPADVALKEGGCLADVAPTILALMGVEPPPAMTGSSLLAGKG